MKKRIPGILIFIGALLLMSQLRLYRHLSQEANNADIRLNRYSRQVKTVFHIDFPDKWDFYSIQHFLGQVLGTYFFVIIGVIMIVIGLRMTLKNKWSGSNKLLGKKIQFLIRKHGQPDQKILLANGSTIYIYSELDESASKTHRALKFEELGADASKLSNDDLNIYNYYIVKTNSEEEIVNFRTYRFEGRFTDANEVENWDDFLKQ